MPEHPTIFLNCFLNLKLCGPPNPMKFQIFARFFFSRFIQKFQTQPGNCIFHHSWWRHDKTGTNIFYPFSIFFPYCKLTWWFCSVRFRGRKMIVSLFVNPVSGGVRNAAVRVLRLWHSIPPRSGVFDTIPRPVSCTHLSSLQNSFKLFSNVVKKFPLKRNVGGSPPHLSRQSLSLLGVAGAGAYSLFVLHNKRVFCEEFGSKKQNRVQAFRDAQLEVREHVKDESFSSISWLGRHHPGLHSIDWLMAFWFIDWFINAFVCSIDWLIDWLICLIVAAP